MTAPEPTPTLPAGSGQPWLRRHWRWLVLPAVLLLAAAGAWELALWQLKAAVQQALGPSSQVARIHVGLGGVLIEDLRIRSNRSPERRSVAEAGPAAARPAADALWPVDDELRADRVRVVPDWRSLWSGPRHGQWRLQSLQVQGAYLSLRRTAKGQLQLLPSLLPGPAAAPATGGAAASNTQLLLGQLRLEGSVVELFDASVRRPAHRLRLEDLSVQAGPVHLPPATAQAATPATQLQLRATLKGPRHDGSLSLQGQLHLASHDAKLQARLQGVDMLALQPYLLKAGEGRIRGGRLDLQLDPQVQQQRLHAPGVLTLTGLDLEPGAGLGGLLAGVSRQALLNTLQRDGRITLRFSLDGRLDDPAFSLNESLAQRVSGALAEAVGVSLSGVVDGVGGLLKGLLGR